MLTAYRLRNVFLNIKVSYISFLSTCHWSKQLLKEMFYFSSIYLCKKYLINPSIYLKGALIYTETYIIISYFQRRSSNAIIYEILKQNAYSLRYAFKWKIFLFLISVIQTIVKRCVLIV